MILTRFAVEVQIKDNFVTLGGEVTSKANYSRRTLPPLSVPPSIRSVTHLNIKRWGKENTICGDELVTPTHRSSPGHAQGVDNSAWGDQGIFHGMAVSTTETDYMPSDWYLAKKIRRRSTTSAMPDWTSRPSYDVGRQAEEIVVAIDANEAQFAGYCQRRSGAEK